MEQLLLKNSIKKAQGNILLAIFFIIIILILILLFTQYHKIILVSNYNTNNHKMKNIELYSFKQQLISCYGYPLEITSINDCDSIENMNFKIQILEDVLCTEEIILQNKVETDFQLNLFFPIKDSNSRICPGQVFLYFDES